MRMNPKFILWSVLCGIAGCSSMPVLAPDAAPHPGVCEIKTIRDDRGIRYASPCRNDMPEFICDTQFLADEVAFTEETSVEDLRNGLELACSIKSSLMYGSKALQWDGSELPWEHYEIIARPESVYIGRESSGVRAVFHRHNAVSASRGKSGEVHLDYIILCR